MSRDPGCGVVDEITGNSGFLQPGEPSSFCWTEQPQATSYEIVRSTDPGFPIRLFLSGRCFGCLLVGSAPSVGQGYFSLVRAPTPNQESWGQDGSGAELSSACLIETICADGLDNDGDLLTDCVDPDCATDPSCVPG